jgi:hypothetical protein
MIVRLVDITLPPQTQLEEDSPPLGFRFGLWGFMGRVNVYSPLLCSRDWEWWEKHFYQKC